MPTKQELQSHWLKCSNSSDKYFYHKKFKEYLDSLPDETKQVSQPRTPQQSRALHLWLSMVAEELDKHGHTIQNVVEKIRKAEIRPTKDNLKEVMWKPYQMAALQKDSTTKLTKHEVDIVYEGLNKFLGQEFEIHIPFPHEEKTNVRLSQLENLKDDNYPEFIGKPKI